MVRRICSKHGYPFIEDEDCPDCVKLLSDAEAGLTSVSPNVPPPVFEDVPPRVIIQHAPAANPPDLLAEAATRVPDYYQTGLRTTTGEPADVMDLVEARWGDEDNFCEKDILKYLLRAGRKPGVPAERDWLKIVRVAARKYRRLSGEDLPDDV